MERLQQYLKDSEMTQAQLAAAIGVSQPTISDWINGHMSPSFDRLIVISRVTGLSLDELVDDKSAA